VVAVNTYTATAEYRTDPDGAFWSIYSPTVDRWTEARHLRDVETMARDLIACMLTATGTPTAVDAFNLELTIKSPGRVLSTA
jgi:hypothetical protein